MSLNKDVGIGASSWAMKREMTPYLLIKIIKWVKETKGSTTIVTFHWYPLHGKLLKAFWMHWPISSAWSQLNFSRAINPESNACTFTWLGSKGSWLPKSTQPFIFCKLLKSLFKRLFLRSSCWGLVLLVLLVLQYNNYYFNACCVSKEYMHRHFLESDLLYFWLFASWLVL